MSETCYMTPKKKKKKPTYVLLIAYILVTFKSNLLLENVNNLTALSFYKI